MAEKNVNLKFIFLYTEMAGYMLACMKKLAAERKAEVHVIMYPVNPVAPFRFSLDGENMHYYQRNKYSDNGLLLLCREIAPDIIFCGGWTDKGYLKICAAFENKIKTVLTLDNPWRNTLKQNIAALLGPFWLKKYFNHAWVAGAPQKIYALKLGFRDKNIKEGVYSCDFDYFHGRYLETKELKEKVFPNKIIFVGRYTKLKGVKELWDAFRIFQEKKSSEWELWCLGKGDMENDFPRHEKIINFGFVQPAEMKKFIAESGIFILPSHYEHWGVVVHEFAAAGFPLICSTTTSAASKFLEEGQNGFFHEPCNVNSLVEVLEKITSLPHSELVKMSAHSALLAAKITPETWCDTAISFLKN